MTHEPWCMARPGETEPRTETYTVRLDDGHAVTTHRCVECGVCEYTHLGKV